MVRTVLGLKWGGVPQLASGALCTTAPYRPICTCSWTCEALWYKYVPGRRSVADQL